MKRYVPVRNFERLTGLCPTYIAWRVLDEARDFFREAIPEDYAGRLARRAEAVFKKHDFWRRRYRGRHGRGHLLASMRHWLASVLAAEKPSLYRLLPDDFKNGRPLPLESAPKPASSRKIRTSAVRARHFVHGWELLLP